MSRATPEGILQQRWMIVGRQAAEQQQTRYIQRSRKAYLSLPPQRTKPGIVMSDPSPSPVPAYSAQNCQRYTTTAVECSIPRLVPQTLNLCERTTHCRAGQSRQTILAARGWSGDVTLCAAAVNNLRNLPREIYEIYYEKSLSGKMRGATSVHA